MDESYEIGEKVELIHPARFLFNAGSTPKDWNKKMLQDPHFKILKYEENSKRIFPNKDIKGGVVISYRDKRENFGPIGIYVPNENLNIILSKPEVPSFYIYVGIATSIISYSLACFAVISDRWCALPGCW